MNRTVRFAVAVAIAACAASPARATAPPYQGSLPQAVADAFRTGAFSVPVHATGLGTSAVNVWRVPIIMIAFRDEPLTYHKEDFEHELFDTTRAVPTGSLFDYYQWTSRGLLRVVGEVVATVTLPNDRAYYAQNAFGLDVTATPCNAYGALRDALMLSASGVDWSPYDMDHDGYVDMVWLLHAGQGGETSRDGNSFWSFTTHSGAWRLGEPYKTGTKVPGTDDHFIRIDRFSVVPELSGVHPGSICEIGVFCHEFGHALGLPDLYDTSILGGAANVGPGNWALMSTGLYGANGVSPESPSHMGAWCTQFLGWDHTVRPERDTTMILPPIENTGDVVELWFQGKPEGEHFLLENRQKGPLFDSTLPMPGLIVTHVDESVIAVRVSSNSINVGDPGMVMVEADGDSDLFVGRNHGDGLDPFPGALNRTHVDDDGHPNLRSFSGAVTQVAIHDIARSGENIRLSLQVRAPNWLPVQDFTHDGYLPLPSYSPAPTCAIGDDGVGYVVRNEIRDGRPQVVLHWGRTEWSPQFQVSHSSGAALDPTLAALPGGDLAVAWSDTRRGRSAIYLRTRIRGAWMDERPVVDLPGTCSAPALAADARGMLNLAFQYAGGGSPQILFTRFTYLSPAGSIHVLSTPDMYPSSPTIAINPKTRATSVLWIDRPLAGSEPQRIWFTRFHPDSGFSPAMTLTRAPAYSQTALAAVCDTAGTLHVIWEVNGPGTYELHYQRRWNSRSPQPRDTTLEQQVAPFQAPTLALDPQSGLHVAYEGNGTRPVEIHYRRWTPENGWDLRSTEVSYGIDGTFEQPVVLPTSHDDVTVLFSGFPGGVPRWLARRRVPPGVTVDAPALRQSVPLLGLAIGPNPARAGATLEIEWNGPVAAPLVDLFDVGGRRVAQAPLVREGSSWRARLSPEAWRDLEPGVYFARVRAQRATARWVLLH